MRFIHQWKGCHTGNSMGSMLMLKFIFGGNGNCFKITYFEKNLSIFGHVYFE